MKCKKCGQEATGRYCSNCGTPLVQEQPIIDIEDFMDDGEEAGSPDAGTDPDATRIFQPETMRSRTVKTDTAEWVSPSRNQSSVSVDQEQMDLEWEEFSSDGDSGAESGAEEESVAEAGEQKASLFDKFKKAMTEVEDDEWADDYEEDEDEEEEEEKTSRSSRSSGGGSRGRSSSRGKSKSKSKKKKKSSRKRSGKSGRKGSGRKSVVSQVGNIICTVLRFLCFFLMLWIWWRVMNDFWDGKDAFGSLSTMVQTGNLAMLVYVAAGALCVAVACISSFWMITKKKVRGSGMSMRCDVGRGLTGFVFFLAVSFCAGAAVLLPDSPTALYGLKQAILVLDNTSILYNAALGTVLCIIRRILRM